MAVLFHLVFELIKISILSSIYALLILIAARVIGRYKPESRLVTFSKNRFRFWLICGGLISIGLFAFMFTYFGNHGLGDDSTIPIGHFKAVREIDVNAYIEDTAFDQVQIRNFTFDKDNLYAQTSDDFVEAKGDYVKWDLIKNELTYYKTKDDYLKAAKVKKYPLPGSFTNFDSHYSRYWNGWRFWVFP